MQTFEVMKFCALSLPVSLQSSQSFLAGRRTMSACRSGKNVKRLFKMGYQEWGEMTGDDMQCWLVLDHPLGISHPSARAVVCLAGAQIYRDFI